MSQLAQRFRLDLANALAGDSERLPHFFQRVLGTVFQTKSHLNDALFARRQRLQQGFCLLLQADADRCV